MMKCLSRMPSSIFFFCLTSVQAWDVLAGNRLSFHICGKVGSVGIKAGGHLQRFRLASYLRWEGSALKLPSNLVPNSNNICSLSMSYLQETWKIYCFVFNTCFWKGLLKVVFWPFQSFWIVICGSTSFVQVNQLHSQCRAISRRPADPTRTRLHGWAEHQSIPIQNVHIFF